MKTNYRKEGGLKVQAEQAAKDAKPEEVQCPISKTKYSWEPLHWKIELATGAIAICNDKLFQADFTEEKPSDAE